MVGGKDEFISHAVTAAAVQSYIDEPVHAALLIGPKGSGKSTVARQVSSGLLARELLEIETYENHPYIRIIRSKEGKAISIEDIRALQHFLSLKIPGNKPGVTRIVVIEDAGLMTTEAQNALLKTLEEPPAGTAVILTASTLDAVLPTIQSRVRQVAILPPSSEQVITYFSERGYSEAAITKAIMISSGLPGLTQALLSDDEQHPLVVAATHARGILQSKAYERLLLVDSLSKQKELCADVLHVLGRMSRMALTRATDTASTDRWNRVMKASFDAERQLSRSVQAKLVLTNFMLAL